MKLFGKKEKCTHKVPTELIESLKEKRDLLMKSRYSKAMKDWVDSVTAILVYRE